MRRRLQAFAVDIQNAEKVNVTSARRHPLSRFRDTIDGMTGPARRTAFPGLQGLADRRRALIEELVTARRESGLTQTDIGAAMGTSQSAIARLERGELDARLSTLERYAAAVGRTVDWQIRTHEEPS
jgi:DNA-binding XRE family transcriptional regulator